MHCPFAPEIDVGKRCPHSECWMHHVGAQGHCAASDTGSTHLVVGDVARVHGETIAEAHTRVDLGREKLKAWLRLLDDLEDVSEGGAVLTVQENSRALAIGRILSLNQVLKMSPDRWRAAMKYVRGKPLSEIRNG